MLNVISDVADTYGSSSTGSQVRIFLPFVDFDHNPHWIDLVNVDIYIFSFLYFCILLRGWVTVIRFIDLM